jgi:hypothetical protein
MLAVIQTIQNQVVEQFVNNDVETMWNEVVMAYSEALSQHLSRGNEKSPKQTQSE